MATRRVSLSINVNIFNKWFYAAIGCGAIGLFILLFGFFKGLGNVALGDAIFLVSGLMSLPFWLIAIGCAVCGQIERLLDATVQADTNQQDLFQGSFSTYTMPPAQNVPQKQCVFCAELIPSNAAVCPVCGNRQQ